MVKTIEIASKSITKNILQKLHLAVFSVQGLAVVTTLVAMASLFSGAYNLSFKEIIDCVATQFGWSETPVPASVAYMLFHLRLPRITLALLIGSILAISGAALQALFRNPLADPGLVGVTSGAMLFTVIGIVITIPISLSAVNITLNYFTLIAFAFVGSLLTTWLVYRLATFGRRTYVATMLLAGIAISALTGAITGLFTYFSNDAQLRNITFWTLGSLSSAQWRFVILLLPVCGTVFYLLIRQARALNLLLLGEQEAAYAGVDVQWVKRTVIICTALGVGASVAACGVIGFVGLVVPHLLRLVRGTDYRWLLPASALLGGSLLIIADTIARTAIAPAELPIGVLTSLLGSPFFLWLLLKSRGRMSIYF